MVRATERRMELQENPYASAVAKVFRDYVTTDASPFGIGAILAVVDKEQDELTPTVALAGKVTVLEAFAVLLAVKHWRATWRGCKLLLEAYSTVALALSKKLSSSTPTC